MRDMFGLPVVKDDRVSLTRRDADGREVDVSYWIVDGTIRVHPARWGDFLEAMWMAATTEAS